jgi:calmodulin
MADDSRNPDLDGQGEEEDKTEYKMITEEIKSEINECFDIFDKDKDN